MPVFPTVTRRSFLKSVLAAAAAPAIVQASSLMPIYVPKQDLWISPGTFFRECEDPLSVMPSTTPRAGDLSLDIKTKDFYVYDGSKWLSIRHSTVADARGLSDSFFD